MSRAELPDAGAVGIAAEDGGAVGAELFLPVTIAWNNLSEVIAALTLNPSLLTPDLSYTSLANSDPEIFIFLVKRAEDLLTANHTTKEDGAKEMPLLEHLFLRGKGDHVAAIASDAGLRSRLMEESFLVAII